MEQSNRQSTKRGVTNAIRSYVVGLQRKTHGAQCCHLLKMSLNLITHRANRTCVCLGGSRNKVACIFNLVYI
jgi:hypothetical protein